MPSVAAKSFAHVFSRPARIAAAAGLAGVAGAAAAVPLWWAGLRRTPAERGSCGLRGLSLPAGPYTLFARAGAWPPPEIRARPPVVLVHGLVVASRMVAPLAALLADRGLPVLAPDLPGFGDSAKPRHALSVPELADALAAGLRAAAAAPADLIGASFGCPVVVELAQRHPDLVRRLVLQGPGPDPAGRHPIRALWRQLADNRRERRSLRRIAYIDYAKAGLRRALANIRLCLAYRLEDRLPLLRVPVLIVRGGSDAICPQPWAERLARLPPDGRLIVVAGPHVLSYSAPEVLAQAVLPFLREAAR
jgi:pimeloyl-ACP methyl ester carboxylesterase